MQFALGSSGKLDQEAGWNALLTWLKEQKFEASEGVEPYYMSRKQVNEKNSKSVQTWSAIQKENKRANAKKMSDARKTGQTLTPKVAKRKRKEQYFVEVCDKHLAWVQTTENVMGLIDKQLKASKQHLLLAGTCSRSTCDNITVAQSRRLKQQARACSRLYAAFIAERKAFVKFVESKGKEITEISVVRKAWKEEKESKSNEELFAETAEYEGLGVTTLKKWEHQLRSIEEG